MSIVWGLKWSRATNLLMEIQSQIQTGPKFILSAIRINPGNWRSNSGFVFIYIYLSLSLFLSLSLLFLTEKKSNGKSKYIVPLSHLTIRTPANLPRKSSHHPTSEVLALAICSFKVRYERTPVGWLIFLIVLHAKRRRATSCYVPELGTGGRWNYDYGNHGKYEAYIYICMYVYDRIWIIRSHIMYIYIYI